ncbi:MAG: alpha/beta hydrolase [Methylovirgula sp.]|jgi:predicted alpha/beta hydrolase family esterase
MRTQDADILIIPGLGNSGPDHWQSRWEAKLSSARRVEQSDWEKPDFADWTKRIGEAIDAADKPVILLAHSLGVIAAVRAAQKHGDKIAGGFLVAPIAERKIEQIAAIDPRFAPVPTEPLPFPSVLVASRDDPYSNFGEAEDMAFAWGSAIADAGFSGHINVESGHGPWPEGLMRFATFLKQLR